MKAPFTAVFAAAAVMAAVVAAAIAAAVMAAVVAAAITAAIMAAVMRVMATARRIAARHNARLFVHFDERRNAQGQNDEHNDERQADERQLHLLQRAAAHRNGDCKRWLPAAKRGLQFSMVAAYCKQKKRPPMDERVDDAANFEARHDD